MRDNIDFLDQIKQLAIVAMFSDDELLEILVLKGGNLLDIVYKISARSSVDIDFSMEGEFASDEELLDRIASTLSSTFLEQGYVTFDVRLRAVPPRLSDDMKAFWGGYKIDFKIIEEARHAAFSDDIDALRRNSLSVGERGSTRFKIDISKHEYCAAKLAYEIEGFRVYGYSPEMMICEKLRALCQQMPDYSRNVKSNPSARARDFLDIHTIREHFAVDVTKLSFRRLLEATFSVKRVPLCLIGEICNFREYHRGDFVAVEATVKPGIELHTFDFYFDYVIEHCGTLKSLWNV